MLINYCTYVQGVRTKIHDLFWLPFSHRLSDSEIFCAIWSTVSGYFVCRLRVMNRFISSKFIVIFPNMVRFGLFLLTGFPPSMSMLFVVIGTFEQDIIVLRHNHHKMAPFDSFNSNMTTIPIDTHTHICQRRTDTFTARTRVTSEMPAISWPQWWTA